MNGHGININNRLRRLRPFFVLAIFAAGLTLTLFAMMSHEGPNTGRVVDQLLQENRERISACEEQDRKALLKAIEDLNRYFDQVEQNIEPFMDDLFSLGSKARLVMYFVRGGGRVDNYLREKTAFHLGGPEALGEEIRRVVGGLQLTVEAHHNVMMVDLEKSVSRTVAVFQQKGLSGEELSGSFENAFRNALSGMLARTAGVQIGVEAVSIVLDIVIAAVLARQLQGLAITGAVLSGGSFAAGGSAVAAGASLGPATAGISVVAGIIVAVAIDWAANKIARADAEEKIRTALSRYRSDSVKAFVESAAEGLTKFHEMRTKALKTALQEEIGRSIG